MVFAISRPSVVTCIFVALPHGFHPSVPRFGVESRPRHQKRPVWAIDVSCRG